MVVSTLKAVKPVLPFSDWVRLEAIVVGSSACRAARADSVNAGVSSGVTVTLHGVVRVDAESAIRAPGRGGVRRATRRRDRHVPR